MAKPFRILSIDGGGIRGIIPGQVLTRLEKKLQDATNDENTRLADHFDLFAGTSTGGILTCTYLIPSRDDPTRPRFSAQDAVDLYLERGDEIFDIPTWHRIRTVGGIRDEKYPAGDLEEALDDYYGELRLSNLLGACLIPSYDIRRRRGHFFKSHIAQQPNEAYDFLVRDVARATSAAPTYFECARIKSSTNVPYPLIDGGVFANNPALCAYVEAGNIVRKVLAPKDVVLLSLGTGEANRSYVHKEAKDWGMAQWIKPLIDIMMSGVADTVDYQLKQIFNSTAATRKRYLRIQPKLTGTLVNPDMDDASSENLLALRELGQETAQNHDDALNDIARLLAQGGWTSAGGES